MNKIFAELGKELIMLGIGEVPTIIAALKEPNPDLSKILAESNEFADILIKKAEEEKTKLDFES